MSNVASLLVGDSLVCKDLTICAQRIYGLPLCGRVTAENTGCMSRYAISLGQRSLILLFRSGTDAVPASGLWSH